MQISMVYEVSVIVSKSYIICDVQFPFCHPSFMDLTYNLLYSIRKEIGTINANEKIFSLLSLVLITFKEKKLKRTYLTETVSSFQQQN